MKLIIYITFFLSSIMIQSQNFKDPIIPKIHVLDNGLTIYMAINKDEPKVQTMIGVKAGSKFDPSDNTGLAHYLEHLMFKGTPRLGTKNWDKEKLLLEEISNLFEAHKMEKDSTAKRNIYKKIDSLSYEASKYAIPNEYDKIVSQLGAQNTNAYTSFDETVYVNLIPSNEMEKWLMLESERFQNLTMRLFHTELEAVYEEFNISQDNDSRWAFSNLLKAMYPKHPYGTQSTIGEGEHLKNPSMVNIRNYFEKYYIPNNICISLSGDIDEKSTLELIKKYFGNWKRKDLKPFNIPQNDIVTKPQFIENFGPQEEFVYLGYRVAGEGSKDALIVKVIDQIMANGTAGIIDLNLVQEQKLLNAYSFPLILKDCGAYVLYGKPKENQTLEQTKDLLLSVLEKFKKGEFEQWLIDASINDIELKTIKEFESNQGKCEAMIHSFIHNVEWSKYINSINEMRKLTKQDLVDFANKNFTSNNYIVSYKRKGAPSVYKVDKPTITPVVMNRDSSSSFFNEIFKTKSSEIEPIFVDYKKEINSEQLSNGIEYFFIKNNSNNLSKLSIIIPKGTQDDKNLTLISKYISYLGTDKLNPTLFREHLFKFGLEFTNNIGRDKSIFSISGLEKNIIKGVSTIFDILNNCKLEESSFKNMIDDIIKERENSLANKNAILGGLSNYAKYGENNPFNHIYSNEELKNITASDLINTIQSLLNLNYKLFFYGQDNENVKKHVSAIIKDKKINKFETNSTKFSIKEANENQIYYYNYPGMVQSQILMTSKADNFDKSSLAFQEIFNSYFGSGLSSIVFQELREQKALAYSAYSAYRIPNNIVEKNNFLQAFIGTQVDKTATALIEFKKLLDNMPQIEIQYNASKLSALKQIASDRITKDNIFWSFLALKNLNIDYDYRKEVYNEIKAYSLSDFATEFAKRISNKKYNTFILGDKSKLKFDDIKEFGNSKELNSKDLFKY